MLGTLPDYSFAKHTDLTHDVGSYQDGALLASCFSNNFGDKIVYYRVYTSREERGQVLSGFDLLGVVVYHEGSHPSFEEMIKEAKRLVK